MKPLRIGFVIHTLESGGAEGQLVEWARALATDEFKCKVYCLVRGGFHEQRIRDLGVDIEILGYRPMRGPDGRLDARAALTGIPALGRLIRAIRRDRPDILHTLLLMSDVMGAVASRFAGHRLRLVGSRRALSDCAGLGGIRAAVLRWAVRKADAVVCNSRAVVEDVIQTQGVAAERVTCIYNGVDVDRFGRARSGREAMRSALGLAPEARTIGYVGQLRPEKGHALLLRSFAELRRRHAAARLLLIGGGPLEPTLRALAGELDIADGVHFLGIRKDIPELLSAMDMFVLPSRTEGFSNVLLEAMASGLPIVASRVGGNPEALDDGGCGLLFESGREEALTAALDRVLSEPETARQLGEAGLRRAREVFSLDALHRQLRAFYRRVAQGG